MPNVKVFILSMQLTKLMDNQFGMGKTTNDLHLLVVVIGTSMTLISVIHISKRMAVLLIHVVLIMQINSKMQNGKELKRLFLLNQIHQR